jgi:hypothetical protein
MTKRLTKWSKGIIVEGKHYWSNDSILKHDNLIRKQTLSEVLKEFKSRLRDERKSPPFDEGIELVLSWAVYWLEQKLKEME